MYLFFDTETAGLPIDFQAPPSRGPNWPRLVTIAWVVTDSEGRELRSSHHLIRPDGWTIEAQATKIHGITTENAVEHGVALSPILDRFAREVLHAGAVIAHNLRFDTGIVGSEYIRAGRNDIVSPKLGLCTMLAGVDVCKLPGKRAGSYKWPKLIELHQALFGQDFGGAHDALVDVLACRRCFFELRKRGHLDPKPLEPPPVVVRGPDPVVSAIEELLG